jgi:hypothetical protein
VRRRRRLLIAASFCVLTLSGIALCRQIIARKVVETVFAQTTGFPIEIGHVKVSLWESCFAAYDIRLLNPPAFGERLFAEIPRFYVEYQFGSLLRGRGPPHLARADLNIRQLVIVTDAEGHSNIQQLRGKPSPFQIDTLNLRIGSITTKDQRASQKEQTRDLSMTVTFRNVTERTDVNRLIRSAVLRRFWFGRAAEHSIDTSNKNHEWARGDADVYCFDLAGNTVRWSHEKTNLSPRETPRSGSGIWSVAPQGTERTEEPNEPLVGCGMIVRSDTRDG